jgi:hypothetical protein
MQEKKLEKNSKTGVSPLVLSQAAAVLQKRRSYASFRAPKGSLDLVWCGWSAIRGSAGLAAGLWACCWACGLTAGPVELVAHFFFYSFSFSALVCT